MSDSYARIDAAKNAAKTNQFARELQALPPGYIRGFITEIENGRVRINPGVCSYRGTRIDLAYVSYVFGDGYIRTLEASTVYYLYLTEDRKFFVYSEKPVWTAAYQNWYHPDTNYLFIATLKTDASAVINIAQQWYEYQLQPLDATLTALAGLATGADKVPYSTGTDVFSQASLTAFARTILDDADAETVRDTIMAGTKHNSIINGDMAKNQRFEAAAASIVEATPSGYTLDRWELAIGGSAGADVSRSTDVPTFAQAGILHKFSLKIDVTTADTTGHTDHYIYLNQKIEGQMFAPLVGKTATLSFWVKSPKTGIHCVGFRNSSVDKNIIKEYTVNVADTWEFKTVTITFDYTGGTWNYTTGIGIRVGFVLLNGSDYYASAGTWIATNDSSTSNQVNCFDSNANNFYITGVMLNEGSVAAPFRLCGGTPAQEELLCQRYLPCMNGDDINDRLGLVGFCFTTDDCMIEWEFKIVARAAPTSIVATITDFYINTNTGAAVNIDAIALAGPSRFGVGLNVDVAGTPLVAGDGTTLVCLTAGAKMYLNGCEL